MPLPANNIDFYLSIWDAIEGFVPPAKRRDAALKYLIVLEDGDADFSPEDLEGENENLDEAIELRANPAIDEVDTVDGDEEDI